VSKMVTEFDKKLLVSWEKQGKKAWKENKRAKRSYHYPQEFTEKEYVNPYLWMKKSVWRI